VAQFSVGGNTAVRIAAPVFGKPTDRSFRQNGLSCCRGRANHGG